MASVNKVIIVGNLGRDPEVRYTPNGSAVCNVTRRDLAQVRKNKDSGEKSEDTEWHRVVFFDKLAEIAGEYLKKGRSVYVEGRLQTRKWHDKDGVEKYTTEIVATEMQMLGSREGMGGGAAERRRRRLRALGAGGAARSGGGEPACSEVDLGLQRHGRRHPVLSVAARFARSARRGAAVAADLERPRPARRVLAPRRAHVSVSSRRRRRRTSTFANGGMPNGRGLPGVVGGKPPRRTMWTRLAGGDMRDRAVARQRRIGARARLRRRRRGSRRNGSRRAWRRARCVAAAAGAPSTPRVTAPCAGRLRRYSAIAARSASLRYCVERATTSAIGPCTEAARRDAGLQQRHDLALRPVADAGLGVVAQRRRVPVLDRDQAAGEVERARGRAEDVAAASGRRCNGRASRRGRRRGSTRPSARRRPRSAPGRKKSARQTASAACWSNGKPSACGRVRPAPPAPGVLQVGEHRVGVGARQARVVRVRKRRIEQAAVARAAVVQRAPEVVGAPARRGRSRIGREVGRVDDAERRLDRAPARVGRAARLGVAAEAAAGAHEVVAAGDAAALLAAAPRTRGVARGRRRD